MGARLGQVRCATSPMVQKLDLAENTRHCQRRFEGAIPALRGNSLRCNVVLRAGQVSPGL